MSQIREQLMSRSTNSVLVVAHRGDWRNFPENSLEGIENAIKMGVDIVELDVQRTQDGVLILMHDETLNRTTTGKGKVSEVTMDYISNLYQIKDFPFNIAGIFLGNSLLPFINNSSKKKIT